MASPVPTMRTSSTESNLRFSIFCRISSDVECFGIVDKFSLFPASHAVSKLAALTQALITLSSVDSPEHPEHPWAARLSGHEYSEQDLPHRHVFWLLAFLPITLNLISIHFCQVLTTMLQEPKQVPKKLKVDTFQKYTQRFAYSVSWINMDTSKGSTSLPSINSSLFRTYLNLNTSFPLFYRLIDFLNLSAKFILLIVSYLCDSSGRMSRPIHRPIYRCWKYSSASC